MTDFKPSDLSNVSTLQSSDLIVISQDAGGGNFTSVTISVDDFNDNIVANVVSTTVTYNVTSNNRFIACDASVGAISINLPTAASTTGKIFEVKKTDSTGNVITIDGNGSETIDGSLTQPLSVQYMNVSILSDGSEWHIL